MAHRPLRGPVRDDRREDIRATFQRVRGPLQWPMDNFRRRKITTPAFVGYRFSRAKGKSVAGFAVGFALREGFLPGIVEPPEAVAYVFVQPRDSALHAALVTRRESLVRQLVRMETKMGVPFEFRPKEEIVAFRHRSLARLPPELFVLAGADFFMTSHPFRAGNFLERLVKATSRPGP